MTTPKHKSQFPEVLTMTVMRNLKSTNTYNKVLQERHNKILDRLEKFWSECDAEDKKCATELLLSTCEIQERKKQVCSWEIPLLDKDDNPVPDKWQTVGFDKPINNDGGWQVSAKKDGLPRIHITTKVAEELKAQLKNKRNLKVFE
jgi:hypothetical protein